MNPSLTTWKESLHNLYATSSMNPSERAMQDFVAALLRQALAGKSAKAKWYRLQPAHVRALVKFHRAILHHGRNEIHIRKEMYDVTGDCPFRLTYDELNNFSFLRTFALVAHYDEKNPRSGYWKMTNLGGKFLKGDAPVPIKKLILNGEIVQTDYASARDVRFFNGKIPEYPKTFDYVDVPLDGAPAQKLFPEPAKVASPSPNQWH